MGPGASQRTLLKHLRSDLTLGPSRTSRDEFTYFDTIDWRLHASGRKLSLQGQNDRTLLSLARVARTLVIAQKVEKVPSFASELPAGPVRSRLVPLVGVRRLHPVATVDLRSRQYSVLDDERKTVVRIVFEQARVKDPAGSGELVELPETLHLLPVVGYRKAHAAVIASLAERTGLTPIDQDIATRALTALGAAPMPRSTGLEVQLDATAPIGAAFVALQRGLFEAMQINEPGIRADLDTEYLHDFRVSCRRTRLLHRIFRSVIRKSAFEALVPRIRWIRKVAGPTRDLDVQLLELAEEREVLGEKLDALLPLEALMREHRHAEWQKLVAVLESPEYAELQEVAAALLDFPEAAEVLEVARLGPPLGPWASKRIAKAARALIQLGRRIDDDSPDDEIHALRLSGKQLRYLLELFRSLYSELEMKVLIKELKRLQDNLGAFNDACVRVELLRGLASELSERGPDGTDALVAVGRLVERTEIRKQRERRAFARRFDRFDARKNRARLAHLFAGGKKKWLLER
jgi:CHAD domain-containing protein